MAEGQDPAESELEAPSVLSAFQQELQTLPCQFHPPSCGFAPTTPGAGSGVQGGCLKIYGYRLPCLSSGCLKCTLPALTSGGLSGAFTPSCISPFCCHWSCRSPQLFFSPVFLPFSPYPPFSLICLLLIPEVTTSAASQGLSLDLLMVGQSSYRGAQAPLKAQELTVCSEILQPF